MTPIRYPRCCAAQTMSAQRSSGRPCNKRDHIWFGGAWLYGREELCGGGHRSATFFCNFRPISSGAAVASHLIGARLLAWVPPGGRGCFFVARERGVRILA